MYENYTAEQARRDSFGGCDRHELERAVKREHDRIKKAAAEGRRRCAMYYWRSDTPLGAELRKVMDGEGYDIYDEEVHMCGVGNLLHPYIHW